MDAEILCGMLMDLEDNALTLSATYPSFRESAVADSQARILGSIRSIGEQTRLACEAVHCWLVPGHRPAPEPLPSAQHSKTVLTAIAAQIGLMKTLIEQSPAASGTDVDSECAEVVYYQLRQIISAMDAITAFVVTVSKTPQVTDMVTEVEAAKIMHAMGAVHEWKFRRSSSQMRLVAFLMGEFLRSRAFSTIGEIAKETGVQNDMVKKLIQDLENHMHGSGYYLETRQKKGRPGNVLCYGLRKITPDAG